MANEKTQTEREFILYLMKKQSNRLFQYADLGYAETMAKVMSSEGDFSSCSSKDKEWLTFYKDEIQELVVLTNRLETITKEEIK